MQSIVQEIYPGSQRCCDYDWKARAMRRPKLAMNLERAEENLGLMKDVFDDLGVIHWLCFGTLLGAVRDKKFIAHDTDIDIGLFMYKPTVRVLLVKAVRKLEQNGFRLIRDQGDLITLMREDEYIDLYAFEIRIRRLRRMWHCMGWEFPYKQFASFERIRFMDREFYTPTGVEEHLSQVYGLDWRIPKEGFHPQDPVKELGIVGRLLQKVGLRSKWMRLWKRIEH